jgi:hypothetical protein
LAIGYWLLARSAFSVFSVVIFPFLGVALLAQNALADAAGRYSTGPRSAEDGGSGRYYLGREIAQVMATKERVGWSGRSGKGKNKLAK